MLEKTFAVLLSIAAVYAACGVVVAALFLARWCKSFDPSAKDGTWGFRVLIVPGVVALWPVIVAKVLALRRGGGAGGEAETPVSPGTLRRNHGFAFLALALVAPLLFAIALIWRAPEIPRSGGVPPPSNTNGAGTAPLPAP